MEMVEPTWWRQDQQATSQDLAWKKPTDFKKDSKQVGEILDSAKKLHMVTDVKKAIFQAIMMSDDYLHAYEQLMHLNLKKTQEREIVRVLLQCCIAEKTYNPFYYYLSTKLLTDINFKYTYKYALWDYIKSIEKLEIH